MGNLSQTYDGTPKTASATTNPAGLAVTLTYDGSSTAPTNVGSYSVVATINDPNYLGSANSTLNIGKATATITMGDLNQIYDATPKLVTATTTPTGLAVDINYNGSSTVPTNPGIYSAVATIIDSNYLGTASGTLNIAKANQTINFTLPATATFKETITLNATVTSNLSVSYVVTNGPGLINGTTLSFTGKGDVIVTASQSGDNNFNFAADVQRTIVVTTH